MATADYRFIMQNQSHNHRKCILTFRSQEYWCSLPFHSLQVSSHHRNQQFGSYEEFLSQQTRLCSVCLVCHQAPNLLKSDNLWCKWSLWYLCQLTKPAAFVPPCRWHQIILWVIFMLLSVGDFALIINITQAGSLCWLQINKKENLKTSWQKPFRLFVTAHRTFGFNQANKRHSLMNCRPKEKSFVFTALSIVKTTTAINHHNNHKSKYCRYRTSVKSLKTSESEILPPSVLPLTHFSFVPFSLSLPSLKLTSEQSIQLCSPALQTNLWPYTELWDHLPLSLNYRHRSEVIRCPLPSRSIEFF